MTLKEYLKSQKVLQRVLAARSGVHQSTISRVSNGKALPTLVDAWAIYTHTDHLVGMADYFPEAQKNERDT